MAQVSRKHGPISWGPFPTRACSPNYAPPRELQHARDVPDLRHTLCSCAGSREVPGTKEQQRGPKQLQGSCQGREDVLGQPHSLSCGETEVLKEILSPMCSFK